MPNLSDFDFHLPEDRIALRPARPRRAARLLVARPDRTEHATMADLPSLLRPGDLLVFNDTRVIAARLEGRRTRENSEARIEATLIERLGPERWRALARPAKRLRMGDRIVFASSEEALSADVMAKDGEGGVELCFDRAGAALDAALAQVGRMPLPPYIASKRPADALDREDYQTIFAKTDGAVAAPTAALHFDPPLLDALDAAGVRRTTLTLHVGAGTFLPVKTEDLTEHRMHAEWGELSAQTAEAVNRTRDQGGRVIAVGTTALRLLETAVAETGRVAEWRSATDLFITPGYRFRAVDALLTNFHLPRSTLLVLVCALMGRERMLSAYAEAVEKGYRFYSYGDASLLLPGG